MQQWLAVAIASHITGVPAIEPQPAKLVVVELMSLLLSISKAVQSV